MTTAKHPKSYNDEAQYVGYVLLSWNEQETIELCLAGRAQIKRYKTDQHQGNELGTHTYA